MIIAAPKLRQSQYCKPNDSWYAWRAKNPLGKRIEASGVLAKLDNASSEDLKRTERLLLQLLSVQPVPLSKQRRKSKKLPARHLEQIPFRFEHSQHGERNSCILLPGNRQLCARSCAPDAGSCAQPPCAGEPSLC